MSYLFIITGHKFIIYIPICRYPPVKWLVTPGNMAKQHSGIRLFMPGVLTNQSCYNFQAGDEVCYAAICLQMYKAIHF
jgi:hypothetical protein